MLIAPALQVDFNACYMQDRQKFPLECLRCLALILIPVLSCFFGRNWRWRMPYFVAKLLTSKIFRKSWDRLQKTTFVGRNHSTAKFVHFDGKKKLLYLLKLFPLLWLCRLPWVSKDCIRHPALGWCCVHLLLASSVTALPYVKDN